MKLEQELDFRPDSAVSVDRTGKRAPLAPTYATGFRVAGLALCLVRRYDPLYHRNLATLGNLRPWLPDFPD